MFTTHTAGKLLKDDDYSEVCEALYPARHKWRQIGIKLQLKRQDLDNIASEYESKGNIRCLEEVVSMFLNRPSRNPTWKVIINALRSKIVNEEALAVEIKERYGESDIKNPPENTLILCGIHSYMSA